MKLEKPVIQRSARECRQRHIVPSAAALHWLFVEFFCVQVHGRCDREWVHAVNQILIDLNYSCTVKSAVSHIK